MAVMPDECAAAFRSDDPAFALFRINRRRRAAPESHSLREDIEPLKRLIVGDVLLGLGGKDVGQFERRRCGH